MLAGDASRAGRPGAGAKARLIKIVATASFCDATYSTASVVDNSLKPCENPGDIAVDSNMRHSRARGWYARGLCSLALCTFVASSSKAGQTAVPRSIAAKANSGVASGQTPPSQDHVHGAESD